MSDTLTVHPVIEAWVRQLLDADTLGFLESAMEGHQVEVRLYVSAGRVRKRPTVILDGGPQQNVSPESAGGFSD